jgi:PAS domain S-box-containing protein
VVYSEGEDMHTSTDGWFLSAGDRDEWPTGTLSTDTILDTITDVFYVVDRRGRFREWNERFREVTGYTDDEIADLHQFDIIPDTSEAEARELLSTVADGAEVTLEAPLVTADGERVPHEFTASPLADDDGEVWGMAGTARDISDHRAREDLLGDLHDASRELLAAETEREVAEATARIAYDRFDCATVGVRLLEDDQLVMVAAESDDDRLDGRLPPVAVGEGFVGEAYEQGEAVVYDTLDDVDPGVHYPARSKLLVPIPGYGMLNMAATEPGAFDEVDLELGRVFAADVEAALERADRERRLRERKRELEQYETVVETMGDGVYATDADRRVTMVNDTMAEMLGRDREELLGANATIATSDEAVVEEAARLREQLRTGEEAAVTHEAPLTTADGESVPVENRMSALPGEEFRGTVGVVRDVTEQREREQLLRDLHETSRTLLTAKTRTEVAERATQAAHLLGFGSVAVRLLDEDGRLSLVARETNDERFERIEMPDVEPGEGFIGEIYDEGAPAVYGDEEASAISGDEADEYDVDLMESAMFLPIPGHGMISVASSEANVFDETDLELGRVFAADVEAALERADREQRLRERKRDLERYETLVETISDGVYMTSPDRRITMVNDALTVLLGRDRDDLLGKPTSVATPDDVLEEAGRLKRRLLDGEASVVTLHGELERADGRQVPIENRFSLLPGEGDQGTVGVIRDVTERRRREEQLKQSRDELARLNRINELIQETIHALASTATREEIEATVCRQLAESEFYRFAMTGELVHSEGRVVPTEWAGDGADYTEAFSVTTADEATGLGPAGRAIRSGEAQVCQDIRTDPQFQPWRDAAVENGFESAVAIPLRHGETVHGILCVYAAEQNAFSGRELAAFEVLGDMVGFAINATQNRRLIQADDLLEFEFRVTEAGTVTAGLTESLNCRYRLLGVASTADPGLLHYTVVEGASAEAVQDVLADTDESERVRNVRVVSAEGDTVLLEARIVESIPAVLQESGVQTVAATAVGGTIEFVARGPRDLDFRALLDRLEATHGETELVAKRTVDAEVRAGETPRDRVDDRLTDRQSAALNAAYFSGYFDWPRDSTAEEVADALGISSATLHQHLRHAQRKLLEACFVDGSEPSA